MKSKPKILLVDDKLENIVALEQLLADPGTDFLRATSGNEALSMTLQHEFALVLLDVQMPEMDGFEVVELMRQDKKTMHLPVIFVSAVYSDDYYKIKGIESGAVDFITKPIIPEILIGKVRIFLDIFNQRKELEALLDEKEVLLKEISHRVKNNFQLIFSLLALGADNIKDSDSLEVLEDCQHRVKTMALIHEKLYKSKSFTDINFTEYIKELIEDLSISYGAEKNNINLNIESENVKLEIKQIIQCGLIVNELVSNSFKYAFPPERTGGKEINIEIRGDNSGIIELVVSDNGIGIPEDFDFENSETLGLKLVDIIARNELEGDVNIRSENGTAFQIRFNSNLQNKEAT